MKSKKKLQFIRDTYEFYFNRSKPFRDTELTEQEKEAFDSIEKDLEVLEHYRKVKSYIERMYEKPFYEKTGRYISKWEKDSNYYFIDYNFENDSIDVIDYECELSVKVDDIEKAIIFYNDEIEAEWQKQEEKENKEYEKRLKKMSLSGFNIPVFNCISGGNKDDK